MIISLVWETLMNTTHHEDQSVIAVGIARFCIMRVTLRRYVTFPRGFADHYVGDGHSLLKSTHYAPTKL